MVIIDVDAVSASYPTKPLFADLSFTVGAGERIGVVGINGSGKSTLLRVISGEMVPDSGEVRRRRGLRIATMDQRPQFGDRTVREIVGDRWQAAAAIERLDLGALADRPVGALSGGQARRVALAAALVDDDAELLVLDEPTNHLDIDGLDHLEQVLMKHRGGVVFVSHDRHLLDRVATRIVGLTRAGNLVVEGGYEAYLDAQLDADRQAAKQEASRQILARRELEWLRRGARARRRKPKARLAVAHRTLAAPELETDRSSPLGLAEFGATRLGRVVVDLHGVGGAHDDGVSLFDGVDLSLDPRARLGVVGPNGAGKSTLLDIIAGRRAPTEGRVERGATVRIGYFDQQGVSLDQQATVEEIVAGPGNTLDHLQLSLLKRFWFEPATHRAQVASLSGGEQRRLQLLALLAAEPNVLLLDEPTNDLDLDTLRALESWLDDFEGAVVAVTHDRVFLERSIDHVIAIGGGELRVLGAGEAVWEHARASSSPRRQRREQRPRGSASGTRSASTLRHLLKASESELARAQATRDQLAAELETASGHEEMGRLGELVASAEVQLAQVEEQWLELAAEAEQAGEAG